MADAGEAPADGTAACRERRRHPPARSPTPPSTASSLARCSSTSPTTAPPCAELHRVLKPGGTLAVTVPTWLPEKVCWALSDEYHAPFVAGRPRPHLHRAASCAGSMRDAGLRPGGRHHAHALHSPYWWLKCAVGPTNDDHPLVQGVPPAAGVGHRQGAAAHPLDRAGPQPGARQEPRRLRPQAAPPERRAPRPSADGASPDAARLRSPGIVTAAEVQATVDTIAEWQLPVGHDPVVPRRPRRPLEPRRGGHGPRPRRPPGRGRAGLRVAGRPAAPRRLLAPVLPGRPRRAGQARRQRHAPTSPPACGTTGCSPSDRGLRRGDVAGRRRGHRLRARPADRRGARSSGPATPTARRGPSPCSPARRASATACAAPSPSPSSSATSGPTGSCRPPASPTSSAPSPTPSPPSTAGRWTGTTRSWPACSTGDAGRERLAARLDTFVMEGRGVRCVVGPAVGHRGRDLRVRCWPTSRSASATPAERAVRAGPSSTASRRRPLLDRHRVPRGGPLPRRRAVDLHRRLGRAGRRRASSGTSPASALFVDHDAVLPSFDASSWTDRHRRPGAPRSVAPGRSCAAPSELPGAVGDGARRPPYLTLRSETGSPFTLRGRVWQTACGGRGGRPPLGSGRPPPSVGNLGHPGACGRAPGSRDRSR